jgi:glycosyltransferase involved in cell wall biosynthesis
MVIFAGDYDSSRRKGVESLFLQFDEEGFFEKVIFISPLLRDDRRVLLDDRHELHEFGLGRRGVVRRLLAPFHLLRVIVQCRRLVRRERIGVIRATEPTLCGFVAWATARLTRVPYVVSLHADYDKLFALDGRRGAPALGGSRALTGLLERLTLRGAARVLPIRDSLVPYVLKRGVSRDKVRVIPHGIDLTPFTHEPAVDIHTTLGIPPDKAILAFAGRLSAENYVGDVLDAVRRVAERRDDFVLVLAGGGVLEKEIATRLQTDPVLARVVCATGFVSQDTVRALRSGCVVSLCLMGGFSLIEACAAGRPVIAYDVDWHHELVIDGRTGRLIREHDTEGVADAVVAFLDNKAEAARMGAEARNLAFARHDSRNASEVKRRWYLEVLAA